MGVGVAAVMARGFKRKGRFIAALAVHSATPRHWSSFETSLFDEAADRILAAVESVRADEALQRELDRTKLLQSVGVAAASAMGLNELGTAVLRAIAQAAPLRMGMLMILEPEDVLRLVACRGCPSSLLPKIKEISLGNAGLLAVRSVKERRAFTHEDEVLTDERRRLIEEAGATETRYFTMPVQYGQRVMGTLTLTLDGRRPFREDEMATYRTITDVLGQAMENARLFEAEHTIAETLQETLISLPTQVPGVHYSRAYESATLSAGRVGGDFTDIFQVSQHVIGVALGDVSGKGVEAAVTTSLIRNTLRVHAVDGLPPGEIARKANQVMRRFTETDSFVTLWFGLLNTKTGQVRYVCAGHPPALVLEADGTVKELLCRDSILGAFDDASFFEHKTVLCGGERLVLYTDGATEARSPDGEFLGSDGLLSMVSSHAAVPTTLLANAIMGGLVQYSDGILRDDAAILAVEPISVRRACDPPAQLRAFDPDEPDAE